MARRKGRLVTTTQARFLLGRPGRGLSEAQVEARIAAARELAALLLAAFREDAESNRIAQA